MRPSKPKTLITNLAIEPLVRHQVIIVGDFDEDLVKKLLVLYVGTIPRLSPLSSTETPAKVAKREGGFSLKMSGVAKRVDTSVLEEISRACVMLTFPTFNRSV